MLTEDQISTKIRDKEINGRFYKFYSYKADEIDPLDGRDMHLYNIDSISVGGKGELLTLGFLEKFTDIRGLRLNSHSYTSTETLQMLNQLEYFQILDRCDATIPFDRFLKLHSAEINYSHNSCRLLFDNPTIKFLKLHNYKNKSPDDIIKIKSLEQLCLEQCSVENLDFIEQLTQLKGLRISYNRNLKSIQGISNSKNLKKVEIAYCKKIEDWSCLSQADQLNAIIIEDCGEIDSLRFIESLPNLKVLRIIGNTKIMDGSLKSIIDKDSIEYAGIVLHKHYDISQEDLLKFNFVSMTTVMKKID